MPAEPDSHLGLGAAIERQRMRVLVEKRQRQVGDPQAETRTIGQRVCDQAAECIIPAEISVVLARPPRHIGPRCPRQPLRGIVRLQPRGVQKHEIGAWNIVPDRSHHLDFSCPLP
jgi:hypothetical protein